MKVCTEIHPAWRVKPAHCGDLLTFPLAPPRVEMSHMRPSRDGVLSGKLSPSAMIK